MVRNATRWLAMVAVLSLLVSDAAQAGRAGARRTVRQSARTMVSTRTMGHHVAIPSGYYEGVAVSGSRATSRSSTCYANDASKTRVATKTICRSGNCYTSSLFQ